MNFEQFMEEWKPFPKDKVNRQIDKKEKTGDSYDKRQAHVMKAVKNYKTRSTDFHKADQKFTGKDMQKTVTKGNKQVDISDKAADKMDKADAKADKYQDKEQNKIDKWREKRGGKKYPEKKIDKLNAKLDKKRDKAEDKRNEFNKKRGRADAMRQVVKSQGAATKDEDRRQAEINKKSKEDRSKAKRMMDRAKLEKAHNKPAVKGATKGGFKEHMNFTDYVSSLATPLYEKEGEIPKCPPGYKFDKELKMCVPKTSKDAVGDRQKYGDKDMKPGNGAGYNIWGASGYNGDGYAWEEGPTTNDLYNEGRYEDYDEEDKEFAKKDKKMKYGKAERPSSLKPGEVRKPNSRGGFDSNKDEK